MSNPYYKPYWDFSNELEHYGIKGMKWRKKTKFQLKNTKFKDIKVYETASWLSANYGDLFKGFETKQTKSNSKANNVLKKANEKLLQLNDVTLKELNKSTESLGQNIVNKFLSIFKKSK